MSMMLTLILAAAAAHASPVCLKLEDQLAHHEKFWGLMHRTNASSFDQEQRWFEKFPDSENARKVSRAQEVMEREDKGYAEQADRIVTLIIANKCKAPDHVPSWDTYPNPTGKW